MKTTASNGWSVRVAQFFSTTTDGWSIEALRPDGTVKVAQSRKSERGAKKAAAEMLAAIEERGWI